MFDYEDDGDGNSVTTDGADDDSFLDGDMDQDGDVIGDNYGLSSIPYYFYWWGEGFPEYEEMNAQIGACVDIDEDSKIDKEDIGAEGETDLDIFQENMKVVKTVDACGLQCPGPIQKLKCLQTPSLLTLLMTKRNKR